LDKLIFKENAKLVKVREFIYPNYNEEIEKELVEHGITELYSFGKTNLGNLKVIGKGKTGVIVLLDEKRVIKIRRSDSPKESLEIEAKIQTLAFPIAPKVYDYGKNFIIMDYLEGSNLNNTRKNKRVIVDLLLKAKELESRKIEHKELARPYKNVIVSENDNVYIIDYDSASIKENPYNVTSILSWLRLPNLAILYKKHKNIEEILNFVESLN